LLDYFRSADHPLGITLCRTRFLDHARLTVEHQCVISMRRGPFGSSLGVLSATQQLEIVPKIRGKKIRKMKISFAGLGPLTGSRWLARLAKPNTSYQFRKTGIAAQRIKEGMDFKELQNVGLFLVGPLYPGKRLLVVTKS